MNVAAEHPTLRKTEQGCLALADISGYTSYLAGAELDHAQDVLEDLTQTVVSALAPPMQLAKLEGDAAFVYAPGDRIDASMLLDTVDATYFAFRRRLDAIDRATQCQCNACVLIPRLDLKLVAHHGRFGRQHVAGREELSGSDVIAVHRLLKNSIASSIGHPGYAFYTDAMTAAMGVDPAALHLQPHAEDIEDIGRMSGWVQDLHDRWTEEKERRRVKVSPEQAAMTLVHELPAPRAMAWNYLTDPALRPTWQPGTLRVDQATRGGRRGVGTTNHCVHGKDASLEEVLDWRPHDYFTIETQIPAPLIGPLRMTHELEDAPGGSRLTLRVASPDTRRQRLVLRLIGPVFRRKTVASNEALAAALAAAPAEAPAEAPPEPG